MWVRGWVASALSKIFVNCIPKILHFQQDNHPVRTADRIQELFNRRPDIDLLEWPPNSPEWIRLKMCGLEWKGSYALIGQNNPFEYQTNYERVLNTWQEVATDVDLFHNLVDSMPSRMRAKVVCRRNISPFHRPFLKIFFAYVFFIYIWYLPTFRWSK